MTSRKIVNYNTILKRSRCLNSSLMESTNVDSQKIFDNLNRSIDTKKNGRNADTQRLLRSYIESMCNTEAASSKYYQIFNLLEKFNGLDPVISDRILTEYTNRILPYSDPDSLSDIESSLNRKDGLADEQKSIISENVNLFNIADRIVKNHNSITKRFNIERETNRIRATGLKYFVESCAVMIDTYKIKDYQKMNLVIEECYYVLEKNHIDYDKNDLVKYTLEYYLSQNPYISENELNNFKRAITGNYILESSEVDTAQAMLSNDVPATAPYKSINDGIQRFLVCSNKSEKTLSSMINRVLIDTNKQDIIMNIDNLINLLWRFVKNKTFESDEPVYVAFKIIPNHISGCTKLVSNNSADSVDDYSREDLDCIISKLNGIKSEIELVGNSNPMYSSGANSFIKKAINPAIDSLEYTRGILYTKNNIDSIDFVNNNDLEAIPLKEFKIFKFHNLVNAAFNLNKFLKVKEKKFINKAKAKTQRFIARTKNILFGESEDASNYMSKCKDNIYSFIGEDCKASICIKQYFYHESELPELTQFLETVCNEYNDFLASNNKDTIRAYYMINPEVAEIIVKEAAPIVLSESEYKQAIDTFDSSTDTYIENFVQIVRDIDNYVDDSPVSLEEQLLDFSKYNNFTYEHFELALEAMSYLNFDQDIVKVFGERFSDYQFNKVLEEGVLNESYIMLSKQERKVNEAVESWKQEEDVDYSIQLEAYNYLLNIIEEASTPPAVGGKAIEQRKKKPKSPYFYNEDEDDDSEEESSNDNKEKEDTQSQNNNQTQQSSDNTEKYNNPYPLDKQKKSGINLNGIKLGLAGLREKFKAMSNKEKEVSRNLDNSVRSTVASMKQALVSDRREDIIKGRVIPSFSRCIKASLGLAMLGKISGTVTVPLIAAVGGFALSKKLNDRERGFLLDEIETELEVIDKELALADSNNQPNKYRALLQQKKEFQRQYQRIRYNLKLGNSRHILPSELGVKKNDD